MSSKVNPSAGVNVPKVYIPNKERKNLKNSQLINLNLKPGPDLFYFPHSTDFSDANLKNSNLSNQKLMRANFTGADLRDIDLTDTDLRHANFTKAVFDFTTMNEGTFKALYLHKDTIIGLSDSYKNEIALGYQAILKRINEHSTSNLSSARTVSEGWEVKSKEEEPSDENITPIQYEICLHNIISKMHLHERSQLRQLVETRAKNSENSTLLNKETWWALKIALNKNLPEGCLSLPEDIAKTILNKFLDRLLSDLREMKGFKNIANHLGNQITELNQLKTHKITELNQIESEKRQEIENIFATQLEDSQRREMENRHDQIASIRREVDKYLRLIDNREIPTYERYLAKNDVEQRYNAIYQEVSVQIANHWNGIRDKIQREENRWARQIQEYYDQERMNFQENFNKAHNSLTINDFYEELTKSILITISFVPTLLRDQEERQNIYQHHQNLQAGHSEYEYSTVSGVSSWNSSSIKHPIEELCTDIGDFLDDAELMRFSNVNKEINKYAAIPKKERLANFITPYLKPVFSTLTPQEKIKAFKDPKNYVNTKMFFHLEDNLKYRFILKVFIKCRGNVNINDNGYTLLHWAALYGHIGVARLLCQAPDINVNAKDKFLHQTPLHLAAEKGQTEVARLLIARGADINAVKKDGNAPIQLAMNNGNKEIVNLINYHITIHQSQSSSVITNHPITVQKSSCIIS